MVDYALVATVNSAGKRKGHVIADPNEIEALDPHVRRRFVRAAIHPSDVPHVDAPAADEPADPADSAS